VYARGAGAYGTFTVTADVTKYTQAKFLSEIGKQTEVFLRFSTVAGSLGAPDAVRDPRGFALKFYTEEGNYDLVGNNTPVFFVKDGIKFPDFSRTQKRDPYTGSQEPDNVRDFWGLNPESTHQVTWLFGDTPALSHAEDNDFVQAGNLYRLMSEDEKKRLINNLAGSISQVSREDIAKRAIENFRQADEDYGRRLEAAVQALRG